MTDLKVPEKCPRCGGTHFKERSTGPDERYLAFDCKKCELVYSRWADQWYLSQEEDEEYTPETEVLREAKHCPSCTCPATEPAGVIVTHGPDGEVCCGRCGAKDYPLVNHRCKEKKS